MSDNLGAIETDMPDDIQQAVERGQKIAAGRLAYNKWLLTGVWEGDVAHLLEFTKKAIAEQNNSIDSAIVDKVDLEANVKELEKKLFDSKDESEHRLNRLHEEIANNSNYRSQLTLAEREIESQRIALNDLQRNLDEVVEENDNAREDIAALVRTIRLLCRGK